MRNRTDKGELTPLTSLAVILYFGRPKIEERSKRERWLKRFYIPPKNPKEHFFIHVVVDVLWYIFVAEMSNNA